MEEQQPIRGLPFISEAARDWHSFGWPETGAQKPAERCGQQVADEIFETARKASYPSKPSLFTSRWLTDRYVTEVARKMFEEGADQGGLYRVGED
jgi:hypothetical protein